MLAMVTKEFRQMRRDRRTVAMMILMPVVLLLVFGYAANFDIDEIRAGVVGAGADQAQALLRAPFVAEVIDSGGDRESAEVLVRDGDVQVAIVAEPGAPVALVDGSELFHAQAAVQALTVAQQQVPQLQIEVLYNPDLDTSATLVPGLGGLILLFVGTLLTSLGVVRERQAGTLEQLAVMPFRPRDVVIGKIAPYFLVAAVDLVIVLILATTLFNVPFNGSPLILALGAVLFLFATLGIGVFVSTVSENQGQAIQLALMTLMPQVLLSGIIFPLSSMPVGVRWIGYLLPLTYFNMIAKGVMLKAAPLAALTFPFVLLLVLGVVVFALATLRFSRDLSPAGRRG